MPGKQSRTIRVAELFAGVGGFRRGLEAASTSFETVFSSQWEPPGTTTKQFASRCYSREDRFGAEGHANDDIARVLTAVEDGVRNLGRVDLLVGGFPCQDYSVAKPLNQSAGLEGKKGVLWWQIHRMLRLLASSGQAPEWVFLENVDRLLKSPANQRGRDFAIMLASLSDLGYDIEWRVINAADYGFPQRRRRVFILGRRRQRKDVDGTTRVLRDGILARAFPIERSDAGEHLEGPHFRLIGDLDVITRDFGHGVVRSQFLNAGFVNGRKVWTFGVEPDYEGPFVTLGEILLADSEVDESLIIDPASVPKWEYLKGSKNEPRTHRSSGTSYHYTEGALPFPDPLDRPARTILTSEGGTSPSRSKHVVLMADGRRRRLAPVELERLNGFPDGWTDTGMSDNQRAFCMGNALVVGLVERVARVIAKEAGLPLEPAKPEPAKAKPAKAKPAKAKSAKVKSAKSNR
ncbi:MAG: DNA (cytosine-5-)-methyltransferase [Gemmatimonadetes bacterium]|nr:DNA (cytosine-5-)-methyltransferase [Gemmatimonadota bacterium]